MCKLICVDLEQRVILSRLHILAKRSFSVSSFLKQAFLFFCHVEKRQTHVGVKVKGGWRGELFIVQLLQSNYQAFRLLFKRPLIFSSNINSYIVLV